MAFLDFLKSRPSTGIGPGQRHYSAFTEVVQLARSIPKEGWRRTDPTTAEVALGYAAFYYWMVGGEKLSGDPHHYSFPSESTRRVSEMVIRLAIERPRLANAIRRQNPGFDARREIELIPSKLPKDHPIWGECVTRFVIMLCRTLACAAIGQIGELTQVDSRNPQDCLDLGKAIALTIWDADTVALLYPRS
jgi:hypothetical protein